MKYTLSILCITLMLFGCGESNESHSNLIQEDTYINLLVELQLVTSYQKKIQPDSTVIDSLRQLIFKKYDVSQEQFMQSHQFYLQNVEAQKKRIDEAIERLRKDRMAPQDTAQTDTSITAS